MCRVRTRVSLGACAAAVRADDGSIEALDRDAHTFYAVLRPIREHYVEKALRVTGFTRAALERDGREPQEALHEFAAWRRSARRAAQPAQSLTPRWRA